MNIEHDMVPAQTNSIETCYFDIVSPNLNSCLVYEQVKKTPNWSLQLNFGEWYLHVCYLKNEAHMEGGGGFKHAKSKFHTHFIIRCII